MKLNLAIAMNNVKRAMRNELEHYINVLEFEKMERQKEYENGLEIQKVQQKCGFKNFKMPDIYPSILKLINHVFGKRYR